MAELEDVISLTDTRHILLQAPASVEEFCCGGKYPSVFEQTTLGLAALCHNTSVQLAMSNCMAKRDCSQGPVKELG